MRRAETVTLAGGREGGREGPMEEAGHADPRPEITRGEDSDLLDKHLVGGGLTTIPGSGRSPGEGNGNPLQYSCLENPMDRGAWRAMSMGVPKSQT